MLVTAWLTLIVALTISGTAIFYSVTGLTAIFAGAAVAIVIMGTTLEVAKLVAALWLHRHWHEAPRYIRAYLVFAVVVLMAITSLGIFGFLSKAHVEQTAASRDQAAQLERIEASIDDQERAIERAQSRIKDVRSGRAQSDDDNADRVAALRNDIEQTRKRETDRIADARDTIDGIEARVKSEIAPYQEELDQVDQQVAQLDKVIQGLIDLDYLSRAQERQKEQADQRAELAKERREILARIEEIRSAAQPDIEEARDRIEEIRTEADDRVADLRQRIQEMTSQTDGDEATPDQGAIAQQRQLIADARDRIDELSGRKFEIEQDLRALEAKVGPIKYLAAFVAGEDTDRDTLERAVRWVILVIIAVFDPLAVLLLISSQWSFMQHRAMTAAAAGHGGAPTAPVTRQTPSSQSARKPDKGTARETPKTAGTAANPKTSESAAPSTTSASPNQTGGTTSGQPQASTPTAGDAGAQENDDESLKEELRTRVQEGKRKPSPKARGARERQLGDALHRFTDPQAPDFDRAFTQELRANAPASWLAHRKST